MYPWGYMYPRLGIPVLTYTSGVTNVVPAGTRSPSKDHVGRPRACSKNNISMINVFTLTNINTKKIERNMSITVISKVCIKLVALHINRYTRSSSHTQGLQGKSF